MIERRYTLAADPPGQLGVTPVNVVTSRATSKKPPAGTGKSPFNGSVIKAVLIAEVTLALEVVQVVP